MDDRGGAHHSKNALYFFNDWKRWRGGALILRSPPRPISEDLVCIEKIQEGKEKKRSNKQATPNAASF